MNAGNVLTEHKKIKKSKKSQKNKSCAKNQQNKIKVWKNS